MMQNLFQKEITIIAESSSREFEQRVNDCLKQGWQILSSNIAITSVDPNGICAAFQAIMVKYGVVSPIMENPQQSDNKLQLKPLGVWNKSKSGE